MEGLTLKEQAYLKIRQFILSGELKSGTFLTERELTERLGMSRTPVRSALEKLEAEGFISNTPNKGPMVTEMSLSKALDIYDLRIALETHVVRKLCEVSIAPNGWDEIEKNLSEQSLLLQENEYVRFTELDTEFHTKLVNLYQNEEINKTYERIQHQYTLAALRVFKASSKDLKRFYEDHVQIVKLIKMNEPEKCVELVTKHLDIGKSFFFNTNSIY